VGVEGLGPGPSLGRAERPWGEAQRARCLEVHWSARWQADSPVVDPASQAVDPPAADPYLKWGGFLGEDLASQARQHLVGGLHPYVRFREDHWTEGAHSEGVVHPTAVARLYVRFREDHWTEGAAHCLGVFYWPPLRVGHVTVEEGHHGRCLEEGHWCGHW